MARQGKKWKCVEHTELDKVVRGCGGTDTKGKWRVQFFPAIPTYNKKGALRHNKLTLETWDNQTLAEDRVVELNNHFRGALVVPTQQTWLTDQQCRAGEQFFLQDKYSLEQLQFCQRLLATLKESTVESPEELTTFLEALRASKIRCSLSGMVKYCEDAKWRGDLVTRPDVVEAVQKVLRHKMGKYPGGRRTIGDDRLNKLQSYAGYIMAVFQPNYPERVDPAVMTDAAFLEWLCYNYNTPRKEFGPTEIQKWAQACDEARLKGCPEPPKPVEQLVYKLVPVGDQENGIVKFKKVPGQLQYKRPFPRSIVNAFIEVFRTLKNAMALPTLCGEPAAWVSAPGEDVKPIQPTREQQILEAKARARHRRVLTTAEKQRILDASLVVDGGRGAASVLCQGWGGGRRADVERYCKENFVNGRIQIERWQTKNCSCKDVAAMLNFYVCADFLIRCVLWTDENFERGFSDMTRIRILVKAGFWEESWRMLLSAEDTRAGEDFEYQPFELEDVQDVEGLVKQLREHSSLACAWVWHGFTETEKQQLMTFQAAEEAITAIRTTIVNCLNRIMSGPRFYSDELFAGVTLRERTKDLAERNPTGPNVRYLNRLLLEDLFVNKLAKRQGYPPNGLRRSGMSARYQVDESVDNTIEYFSTGKESWEGCYQSMYSKREAREHWQLVYSPMNKSYSPEDRQAFLPAGHKLDDFRTSAVIEAERKNAVLAKEFKESAPAPVQRQPSGHEHRKLYSAEEKASWIEKFKKSGMKQKEFADKNGLVFGVFHRWLELANLTHKTRTAEEIADLITEFEASGLTQEAFAESKGLGVGSLWRYLKDAGKTSTITKRSPSEAARLVIEFEASGLTQKDFAERHDIDVTTLRKYLTKSKAGDFDTSNGQQLSEVVGCRIMTDEQVAAILAEYDPEKTTQEDFAKSKGIGLKTLHQWLKAAGRTDARRSKAQILEYVAQFRKSEMTRFAFAEQIGVTPQTLSRWLDEFPEN